MGLFSRRRPPAAVQEDGPGWVPMTGEMLIEPAGDMGDPVAADAWAFGVTFCLEEQRDADLTLWLYPARDRNGALVLAQRFVHRAYYGGEDWAADTYGTVPPDDGGPYADLAAASDDAERMITGYAQETSTGDAAAPDGTGFDWDGVPWD